MTVWSALVSSILRGDFGG